MMNNIINKLLYTILALGIPCVNIAYSIEQNLQISKKQLVEKYLTAVIIVGAFFILVTIGLTIYNKFFVKVKIDNDEIDTSLLDTPTDKDSALKRYITSNKLQ